MSSKSLAANIQADLSRLYDVFIDAEIVLSSNEIVMHQYGGDKFLVAWSSKPTLGYLLRSCPGFVNTSPICHYIQVLKNNDFSLMLADGSLIQVAYKVENDAIQWHRLCYFPCPIIFSDEDIQEYTVLDLFEVFSDQELHDRTQMVTYFRFDFDRSFSDHRHAHSHFTFGNSECRIPVFGPISIANFFDFIVDHFLQGKYSINRSPQFGQRVYDRTITSGHSYSVYIESQ